MTVLTTKPALNLRDLLARLAGLERRIAAGPPPLLARTGDGAAKSFACTAGYRPVVVWKDGVMQREGAGDAYTVTFDGFVHRVVFAVAPATAARIDILQWRV